MCLPATHACGPPDRPATTSAPRPPHDRPRDRPRPPIHDRQKAIFRKVKATQITAMLVALDERVVRLAASEPGSDRLQKNIAIVTAVRKVRF